MHKFQRVIHFDRIEMGINLDKWVTESILCLALIISFLFWIVHCPSHRFSRWSTRDHTHFIMSRFFPSHKHSIGLKALMLCELVSNILKIQSHLIVLERPFWILFLWPLLFEFVFSVFIVHFSYDISHDNATTKRSQTPHTHADTFTRQREDSIKIEWERKKRRHHRVRLLLWSKHRTVSFVCGRALFFSCHSMLSWHIQYRVQCVQSNGSLPVHNQLDLINDKW